MSETNRNPIVDKSAAKKHDKKLRAVLSAFLDYLARQPRPSDEEVRAEFQRREIEWKTYCIQHKLDVRTSMMFNAKVAYEWGRKRVKADNT